MNWRRLCCVGAGLLSVAVAASAAQKDGIRCAGAIAEAHLTADAQGVLWEQIVLIVKNESSDIKLRFLEYDHFGLACIPDARGKPQVVLHMPCGGNRCSDTDAYGIIDPATLEVRLAPGSGNVTAAERYLGRKIPPIKTVIKQNRQ